MDKVILGMEEIKKASVSDLCQKFSSSEKGISSAEARNRLPVYGYNEIKEKKVNPVLKFLSYFWGPIPWMIEVAAILSAIIHHWEDFVIIAHHIVERNPGTRKRRSFPQSSLQEVRRLVVQLGAPLPGQLVV